jgi:hypothetical protein
MSLRATKIYEHAIAHVIRRKPSGGRDPISALAT